METPYWYRIIVHFDNKKYISNGLTIPFLIGSSCIMHEHVKLISIEEFIRQAADTNMPRAITMLKCGMIKEYVFGVLDNESKPFLSYYKQIGNIVITDDSFHEVENISDLILRLTKLYSPLIDTKKYSKNGGEWGGYTDLDLKRIKEVPF